MYVVSDAEVNEAQDEELQKLGLPTTLEMTLVHELLHALQHQHGRLIQTMEKEDSHWTDVAAASRIVAEGEATYHTFMLMKKVAPFKAQWDGMKRQVGSTGGPPLIVRRLLYLPYLAGSLPFGRARNAHTLGDTFYKKPPIST